MKKSYNKGTIDTGRAWVLFHERVTYKAAEKNVTEVIYKPSYSMSAEDHAKIADAYIKATDPEGNFLGQMGIASTYFDSNEKAFDKKYKQWKLSLNDGLEDIMNAMEVYKEYFQELVKSDDYGLYVEEMKMRDKINQLNC